MFSPGWVFLLSRFWETGRQASSDEKTRTKNENAVRQTMAEADQWLALSRHLRTACKKGDAAV